MKDLKNKWEETYRNTTTKKATNNLKNNMYNQQTLSDGTSYVQTEDNLFTKTDGTPMTQREIFNKIVGKIIRFNDGIEATIVNSLPGDKGIYNELFKKYPNYQNVKNIKKINSTINENMIELLENSDNISQNEPDYNSRHQKK